jgi:hypothetical protein
MGSRLRSGLVRFGLFGGHVTLGLALATLGLALALEFFVIDDGADDLLRFAFHAFDGAFDSCLGA